MISYPNLNSNAHFSNIHELVFYPNLNWNAYFSNIQEIYEYYISNTEYIGENEEYYDYNINTNFSINKDIILYILENGHDPQE